MPSLRDVRHAMRTALLEGDEMEALSVIEGADASTRLDVHRTNLFGSLTDALQRTFPVVCRLVDERFFVFASHEFICDHPPAGPVLAEYGAAFPDFLAEFPPCRELVYLPDVARLEWLIDEARRAPDDAPPTRLDSPWPVERIWRANQAGAPEETISLDDGGVCLEIARRGAVVEIRSVS